MTLPYFLRFATLLHDTDICDMVVPFKAERRLVTPGGFSSGFDIPNSDVGRTVAKIVPQKTVVYVHRGNDILGCYIIWSKKFSRDANGKVTCDLQGASLESYLYRRLLNTDLTYTGTDQIDIANDLISRAQDGSDLYPSNGMILLGTSPVVSGVLRDRTYLASDNKTFGDLLEELASVDSGFDYTVDAYVDDTDRTRMLSFYYPEATGGDNPIIVEEPGAIETWSVLYDGTQGWTRFRARGNRAVVDPSSASEPVQSDWFEATEYLDNDWPVLDCSSDYQNASELDTLNRYAAWWAQHRSGPLAVYSLTLNPQILFRNGFGSFALGTTIVAVLRNPAFPDGFEMSTRMIGFDLSVDQAGKDSLSVLVSTAFDPTEVV